MIAAFCITLTLMLLVYVFWVRSGIESGAEKTRLAYLRDLNFEYKAGKFPESDYTSMRTALEDEAAAVLAEIDLLEKMGQRGATA
jgi:ABC-type lipoprotein release transport system permease subunit